MCAVQSVNVLSPLWFATLPAVGYCATILTPMFGGVKCFCVAGGHHASCGGVEQEGLFSTYLPPPPHLCCRSSHCCVSYCTPSPPSPTSPLFSFIHSFCLSCVATCLPMPSSTGSVSSGMPTRQTFHIYDFFSLSVPYHGIHTAVSHHMPALIGYLLLLWKGGGAMHTFLLLLLPQTQPCHS